MTDETDDAPTCTIIWGRAGSLGIQPRLIVGLTGVLEERRWLEAIAEIAGRRRPKPSEARVLGGNCEPGVLIITNETHFERDAGGKPPRIVAWLMKQIRATVDGGDMLRFKVERSGPKR